jgi:hypothetical protein
MPWKHGDGDEDNKRWQKEDENDEISNMTMWTLMDNNWTTRTMLKDERDGDVNDGGWGGWQR